MKIVVIFTIPLFWGIVSASPPFREINRKVDDLNNLDTQENQNKKIPDLSTIIYDKDESDDDDSRIKIWKRSIFPLFQKDSISILNKENSEDKKDLGFILNGFKIGKRIVDHALQTLSNLVKKSKADKSSLKSEELDKLADIQPKNEPHEVKKRENVKLINVGGKSEEVDKKKLNKNLQRASDLVNQKAAAAKKQEIFNSIPTITVHKQQKNVKSDDKKNDNAPSDNKQKRSNAEALVNVQRNKRGTSMSSWNTPDKDSEEINAVIPHSHVSAVLKNRYASVAEAINSGVAIQKILQKANENVAEVHELDDDFEIEHFNNQFSKWLDDSLEYDWDHEQHLNHHLPSYAPIPQKQGKQIHRNAYRSHARSSANAQATASEHNVPVIKPHDYKNSDLIWQYNKNPGYNDKNYHEKAPRIWQSHHSDENNNPHDINSLDYSTLHILHENERGTNENMKNIRWQDKRMKTEHGQHNMHEWRNYDGHKGNGMDATAFHEKTSMPSIWIAKDKISRNNDDDMAVAWDKPETLIENKYMPPKEQVGTQRFWSNADSAAVASASASRVNGARNSAHAYQRFLPSEWLVDENIENSDHYAVPDTEEIISNTDVAEDISALKYTNDPSVLSLEHEIESLEIVAKAKGKANAESRSETYGTDAKNEESWNRKDALLEANAVSKNKQNSQIEKYGIINSKEDTTSESRTNVEGFARAMLELSRNDKNEVSEMRMGTHHSDFSIINHERDIPSDWPARKHEENVYDDKIQWHDSDQEGRTGDEISDTTASARATANASAGDSKQGQDKVNQKIVDGKLSWVGTDSAVAASGSGSTTDNDWSNAIDQKHKHSQWLSNDNIAKGDNNIALFAKTNVETIAEAKAETSRRGNNKLYDKKDDIYNSRDGIVGKGENIPSDWHSKNIVPSNIHVNTLGGESSVSDNTVTDFETGDQTGHMYKPSEYSPNDKNVKHDNTRESLSEASELAIPEIGAPFYSERKDEIFNNGLQKNNKLEEQDYTVVNGNSIIENNSGFKNKQLEWIIKERNVKHDNKEVFASEANAEAVTEVRDSPLKEGHDEASNNNFEAISPSDKNANAAIESPYASGTSNSNDGDNWEDNNRKSGWIIKDNDTKYIKRVIPVTDEISDVIGKESITEGSGSTIKEKKKSLKGKINSNADDTGAVAPTRPGYVIDSNRGEKHQESDWITNEKGGKHDNSAISTSEANAEAVAEAGSTSLNDDKSGKSSGHNNLLDTKDSEVIATASVSASADSVADDVGEKKHKESGGITNEKGGKHDDSALSKSVANAEAVAEAGSTSLNDDDSGKNSGHNNLLNTKDSVAIAATSASASADSVADDVSDKKQKESDWITNEKGGKHDDSAISTSEANAEAVAEAGSTSLNDDDSGKNSGHNNLLNTEDSVAIATASDSASADSVADNVNDKKHKESDWITKEKDAKLDNSAISMSEANAEAVAEAGSTSLSDDKSEKRLEHNNLLDKADSTAIVTASASASADSVADDVGDKKQKGSDWSTNEKGGKHDDSAISTSEANAEAVAEAGSTSLSDDKSEKRLEHNNLLDKEDSTAIATASASASADSVADNVSDKKHKESDWITKEKDAKLDNSAISTSEANAEAVAEAGSTSLSDDKSEKRLEHNNLLDKGDSTAIATVSASASADSVADDVGDKKQKESDWITNEKGGKHDDSAISTSEANAEAVAEAGSTSLSDDKSEKRLEHNNLLDKEHSTAIATASASASADSVADDVGDKKQKESDWITNEKGGKHDDSAISTSEANAEAVAEAGSTSLNDDDSGKNSGHNNLLNTEDSVAIATASASASADSVADNVNDKKHKESDWITKEKDAKLDNSAISMSEANAEAVAEAGSTSLSDDKSEQRLEHNNLLDKADSTAIVTASASASADSVADDVGDKKQKESDWITKEKDAKLDNSAISTSEANAEAVAEAGSTSLSDDKSEKRLEHNNLLDKADSTAIVTASASASADSVADDVGDKKQKESDWITNKKAGKRDDSAISTSEANAEAVAEAGSRSLNDDDSGKNSGHNNLLNTKDSVAIATASASASADSVADNVSDKKHKESDWITKEKDAKLDDSAISTSEANAEAVADAGSTSLNDDDSGKNSGHNNLLNTKDSVAIATTSASASADSVADDVSDKKHKESDWITKEKDAKLDNSAISTSEANAEAVAEAGSTSLSDDKSEKRLEHNNLLDKADSTAIATASASASADSVADDVGDKKQKESDWITNENGGKHDDSAISTSEANAEAIAEAGSTSLNDDDSGKNSGHNNLLNTKDSVAIATASASASADSVADNVSDKKHKESDWITKEKDAKLGDSAISTSEANAEAVADAGSTSLNDDDSGKNSGHNNLLNTKDSVAIATTSASASADSVADDVSDKKHKESDWITKEKDAKLDNSAISTSEANAEAVAEAGSTSLSDDKSEKRLEHNNLLDKADSTAIVTASASASADSVADDVGDKKQKGSDWITTEKDAKLDNSAISTSEANAEAVAEAGSTSLSDDKSEKRLEHNNLLDKEDSTAIVTASASASADSVADDVGDKKQKESDWITNENGGKHDDSAISTSEANAEAIAEAGSTSLNDDDSGKNSGHNNLLNTKDSVAIATASASASADSVADNVSDKKHKESDWITKEKDAKLDDSAISTSEANAEAVADAGSTSLNDDDSGKNSGHNNLLNTKDSVAIATTSASASADSVADDVSDKKHKESDWITKEKDAKLDNSAISTSEANAEAVAEAGSTSLSDDKSEKRLEHNNLLDKADSTAIVTASASASADSVADDVGDKKQKGSDWITKEKDAKLDNSAISTSEANAEAVAEAGSTSLSDDKSEKRLEHNNLLDKEDSTAIVTASASASADSVADDVGNKKQKESDWITKEKDAKLDNSAISTSEANAEAIAEAGSTSLNDDDSGKNSGHNNLLNTKDSVAIATASASASADSVADNVSDKKRKESDWITKEKDAKLDDSAISTSEANAEAVAEAGSTSLNDDKSGKNSGHNNLLNTNDSVAIATASASASADSVADNVSDKKHKESDWITKEKDAKLDDSAISTSEANAEAVAEAGSTSLNDDDSGKNSGHNNLLNTKDSVAIATTSASASADSVADDVSDKKQKESDWITKEKDAKLDNSAISTSEANAETVAEAGSTSLSDDKSEKRLEHNNLLDKADSTAIVTASASASADSVADDVGDKKQKESDWITKEKDAKLDNSAISTSEANAEAIAEAGSTSLNDDDSGKNSGHNNLLNTKDSVAIATASASASADSVADNVSDKKRKESDWITNEKGGKHDDSAISTSEANAEAVAEAGSTSLSDDKSEKRLEHNNLLGKEHSTAIATASASASADSVADDVGDKKQKESDWITNEKGGKHDDSAISTSEANAEAVAEAGSTSLNDDDSGKNSGHNNLLNTKDSVAIATASASASADSVADDVGDKKQKESDWITKEKDAKLDNSAISTSEANAEAIAEAGSTSLNDDDSGKNSGHNNLLNTKDSVAIATASASASADSVADNVSDKKRKESDWITNEKGGKHDDSAISTSEANAEAVAEAGSTSLSDDKSEKRLEHNNLLDKEHSMAIATASASASADSVADDVGDKKQKESDWITNEKGGKHDDSAISTSEANAEAVAEAGSTSLNDDDSGKNSGHNNLLNTKDSVAIATASASASADSVADDVGDKKQKESDWITKEKDAKLDNSAISTSEANAEAIAEAGSTSLNDDDSGKNSGHNNLLNTKDSVAIATASASASADSVADNVSDKKRKESDWITNEKGGKHDDSAISTSEANAEAVAEAGSTSLSDDKSEKRLEHNNLLDKEHSTAIATASASASADSVADDVGDKKQKESDWITNEKGGKHDDSAISTSEANAEAVAEAGSTSLYDDDSGKNSGHNNLLNTKDSVAIATASASASADSVADNVSDKKRKESDCITNEKGGKHDDSAISTSEANAEAVAEAGSTSLSDDKSEKRLEHNNLLDKEHSTAIATASASASADSVADDVGDKKQKGSDWITNGKGEKHDDSAILVADATAEAVSEAGTMSSIRDHNKSSKVLADKIALGDNDSSGIKYDVIAVTGYKHNQVDESVRVGIPNVAQGQISYIDENAHVISEAEALTTSYGDESEAYPEHSELAIEDRDATDHKDFSSSSVAVASATAGGITVPMSIYKYLHSQKEVSDNRAEAGKYAKSVSAETDSMSANKDKLFDEIVDYKAKDNNNFLTGAKATASAEVTTSTDAESDSVSRSEIRYKHSKLENVNAAEDSVAYDSAGEIENVRPISSWKEEGDVSAEQVTKIDSSVNAEAQNIKKVSNNDKGNGWLVKWVLNDHSLPITAIDKAGVREISHGVRSVIPATTMPVATVEKGLSGKVEVPEEADLIIMRKEYGQQKPMSITYIKNSIPPMVIYRVIPKNVYEQVRKLITQGNIVHASYGQPQISKT